MCNNQKRRSKRIPFRKRVKFGDKTPIHTGHTLNFSYHGVVIESSILYPSGSKIVLEIIDNISTDNGSSGAALAVGRVVWASRGLGVSPRGKMGIEFAKTSKLLKEIYKEKTEV